MFYLDNLSAKDRLQALKMSNTRLHKHLKLYDTAAVSIPQSRHQISLLAAKHKPIY